MKKVLTSLRDAWGTICTWASGPLDDPVADQWTDQPSAQKSEAFYRADTAPFQ